MMNEYSIGQLVRVVNSFTVGPPQAAVPTDPTTVTAVIRSPQGAITTILYPDARIVKDGTGLYHTDVDTTPAPGVWWYRFAGTGTCQAADEGEFFVIPSYA